MDNSMLLLTDPVRFLETQPLAFLFLIALIVAWWRAFKKIGYPGWFSLLFLLPILVPFMLIWVGFHKWPAEKELKKLREEVERLQKLEIVQQLDEMKEEIKEKDDKNK